MHRALTACAVVALVALNACDKPSSTDASPTGSASAPLTGDSAGGRERGRPGPGGGGNEMFEACTGKTAGTACTVKMRDKEMTGTCEAGPGGDATKLACRPAGPPPGAPPPH